MRDIAEQSRLEAQLDLAGTLRLQRAVAEIADGEPRHVDIVDDDGCRTEVCDAVQRSRMHTGLAPRCPQAQGVDHVTPWEERLFGDDP